MCFPWNSRWSITEPMLYSRVLRKLARQMVARFSSLLSTSRGEFSNALHLSAWAILCLVNCANPVWGCLDTVWPQSRKLLLSRMLVLHQTMTEMLFDSMFLNLQPIGGRYNIYPWISCCTCTVCWNEWICTVLVLSLSWGHNTWVLCYERYTWRFRICHNFMVSTTAILFWVIQYLDWYWLLFTRYQELLKLVSKLTEDGKVLNCRVWSSLPYFVSVDIQTIRI